MPADLPAWLGAGFIILGFGWLLARLGLVEIARAVATRSQQAMAVMRNPALDDDAKEALMQAAAKAMFALFFKLTAGLGAALALPMLLVWAVGQAGLVSFDRVIEVSLTWPFLLAGVGVFIAVAMLGRRQTAAKASAASGFENNYGWLDRLLHRLAFSTGALQLDFAEGEDRKLRQRIGNIEPRPPLFITALPRAGTTLLLDRFAELPEFATHTYRDMPFVLVPNLWSRISGGFQQEDVKRERAHGDGMLVGLDSPEAFEEMIWHAFAPERYSGADLKVWPDTLPDEQRDRLAGHMLQIAELRRPGHAATTRYASKNNLNIVRIGLLAQAFPDADIVVPFREPVQHAASLLRQHQNFLAVHARDDFTRSYMAGVGHFDFGASLKPVDFDDWLASTPHRDPLRLDFWLAYWIAAYTHLLDSHGNRIILVGHEALCANPAQVMTALAARLQLADPAGFVASGADIRDSTARPVPTDGVDPALLAAAAALHERLLAAALK